MPPAAGVSADSLQSPDGVKVPPRQQLVHCYPTSGLPGGQPQQACKTPSPAQGSSEQQQQQQLAVPRASGAHGNGGSLRGSRRCTAAAQSDSASSCLNTPKQRPQQAEQQEADGSKRLTTDCCLPGAEGRQRCCTRLERAAARKIVALPHVICHAANGDLYEMSTAHVRRMILHHDLQQLGLVLTAHEEAVLLKQVSGAACLRAASKPACCMLSPAAAAAGAAALPLLLPCQAPSNISDNACWPGTGSRLGGRTFSNTGDALRSTGCGSAAANAGESGGGSQARAARHSTHTSSLPAPGVSRSAVGAALEAHAAAEPVAAQLHEVSWARRADIAAHCPLLAMSVCATAAAAC